MSKSKAERVAEITEFMKTHGPAGCMMLAAQFNVSRSMMQKIVFTTGAFKMVRQAGNGIYAQESLYAPVDSELPEVVIEADVPLNTYPTWVSADPVVEQAMRAMIMEKV
jgi:hypothetical protein